MNKPQRVIDRVVRMAEEIVDEKARLARRFESAQRSAAAYDFHMAAVREVSTEDLYKYQAEFDGGLKIFRETCFELGVEVETIESWVEEIEERIKAYHAKKFA